MDELVGQPAAKAGIDRSVAERAIGIILEFLRSKTLLDEVRCLIGQIPRAEAAIMPPNRNDLPRWMSNTRLAAFDLAGSELVRRGCGMTGIQAITGELLRFGRDKIGADRMGEIIAGTPRLSQFA